MPYEPAVPSPVMELPLQSNVMLSANMLKQVSDETKLEVSMTDCPGTSSEVQFVTLIVMLLEKTQPELMAWENKARRWFVLGLVGVVTGVFGVGLITLHMSYAMLKKTGVMQEAVLRVMRDARVGEALGTPLQLGWA